MRHDPKWMDEADDDGVRVNLRPSVGKEPSAVGKEPSAVGKEPSAVEEEPSAVEEEPSAEEEWEVVQSGEAKELDPGALSQLRAESQSEELARGTDFAAAVDEFDSAPATVMEDVEQLSPAALLEVADGGQLGAADEFEDDSVTRMDPRAGQQHILDGQTGPAKEECPHCGVLVLPGYPNCPRCKRPLVMSVPREQVAKGATSLGGRTVPWAIVVVAAIATAIIVYLAEREPRIADYPSSPAAETSGGTEEAAAGPEAVQEPVAEPDEAAPAPEPEGEAQ